MIVLLKRKMIVDKGLVVFTLSRETLLPESFCPTKGLFIEGRGWSGEIYSIVYHLASDRYRYYLNTDSNYEKYFLANQDELNQVVFQLMRYRDDGWQLPDKAYEQLKRYKILKLPGHIESHDD